MKKLLSSFVISSALLLSQTSLADGWSIGVMVGQSQADAYVIDQPCREIIALSLFAVPVECASDETSTATGINLTYQASDLLGLEVGYVDLGEFETSLREIPPRVSTSTPDYQFSTSAAYAAGVASLHLTDHWSINGRLGIYNLDTSIERDTFYRDGETPYDDSDVYFGASLDYGFSNQLTAQLRYDNFDIDVVSVGLKYNF
jgi:hypothetical protein